MSATSDTAWAEGLIAKALALPDMECIQDKIDEAVTNMFDRMRANKNNEGLHGQISFLLEQGITKPEIESIFNKATIENAIAIARSGIKYFGGSEMDGGITWVLLRLRASVTLEEVETFCMNASIGLAECNIGTGRFFADRADVRIGRHHALITRRWGYDC